MQNVSVDIYVKLCVEYERFFLLILQKIVILKNKESYIIISSQVIN